MGFIADGQIRRQQTRSGANAVVALPTVFNEVAWLAWPMAGLPIARPVNLM